MLTSSFIHIPGIDYAKEQLLWQNNAKTWDMFLENNLSCLPQQTLEYVKKNVIISKDQYARKNHRFFSESLPASEHWRAYPDFNSVFLDIETTGLSKHRNKITTIAMYDGRKSMIFINGKNLDEFPNALKDYSTIVTFNGRRFDVPFILEKFPGMIIDQLHIDLMYVLRQLGYTGGLKRIEKVLGISRDDDIAGVDGLHAVRLWKKYERGDDDALRKLIAYNLADVENLKVLMEFAYKSKAKSIRS